MSPQPLIVAVLVVALAPACAADTPASIVRITLGPEADERAPVSVPTEPENTVEIVFPRPVADWAGRGFTPDPEKFAGDFVVEATRGSERLFVTPVTPSAHRILDVVLSGTDNASRSIPIEFIPAPSGEAWRKVVLLERAPLEDPEPQLSISEDPPASRYRRASPESELGLITTLRLMLNLSAKAASELARLNPALQLQAFDPRPKSYSDFTITPRFALRDATTDTLGICAAVANETARRILFDPLGWVVRVGDHVFPVATVDFAQQLEPFQTSAAFLVLTRAPTGSVTRLATDNRFEISAVLKASVNPRPVLRMPLSGLGPH